jgi:Tfp pilus assembly protein PilF
MQPGAMLASLEAMLARGQDNALVRYGLGGEYLKAGQPDKAAEHLRVALQHDGKYSAAWKLLGQALAQSGAIAEAIATYQQGIGVAEDKGDVQAAKEMTVFLKRLQK